MLIKLILIITYILDNLRRISSYFIILFYFPSNKSDNWHDPKTTFLEWLALSITYSIL